MGHIELETSEVKPVINGFTEPGQQQSSSAGMCYDLTEHIAIAIFNIPLSL